MASPKESALFVMSTANTSQAGPVAVWLTAAGWAAAARLLLGHSWFVTPDGVLTPESARAQASQPSHAPDSRRGMRSAVPVPAKTALKDLRRGLHGFGFRNAALEGPWAEKNVAFVWQHHDLFQFAGFRAARSLDVPLVLFVDAPQVWEARQWGVKRPGWGSLMERYGEQPQFRKADLVACVSEEVAEQALRLGSSEDRVMVTPCSVDTHEFHPDIRSEDIRDRVGLKDRFIVGWLGGFRPFHGLDLLVDAAKLVQRDCPDVAFLLVGDGAERPRLEHRVKSEGVPNVSFAGIVSHHEVPQYLCAMDAATIVDTGQQFHYSPLKLREYMACGVPVITPGVGQVGRWLHDGRDALLIPPGDSKALANAVMRLRDSPELRRSLSRNARAKVVQEGSWEHQVQRVLARLS